MATIVGGTRTLPAWIDRDDLDQEAALARLEAERVGSDPVLSGRAAVSRFVLDEDRRRRREKPASTVFGRPVNGERTACGLEWVEEARKVVGASPSGRMTPGRRERFVRDRMILALSLAGFSQRQIAREFGVARSRVAAIIRDMGRLTGVHK